MARQVPDLQQQRWRHRGRAGGAGWVRRAAVGLQEKKRGEGQAQNYIHSKTNGWWEETLWALGHRWDLLLLNHIIGSSI